MKRYVTVCKIFLCICISLLTVYAKGQDANPCSTGAQTCYFGIEINGTLCGYSVDRYCDGILNGKRIRYESSDVTLKMSLLGSDVDAGFKVMYAIDPTTERAVEIEVSVINNQSVVKCITKITGDTAFYSNRSSGVYKAIPAGRDVMITSQTRYPYLFRDFIKKSSVEKSYKVYDPLKGEITEKRYSRKSDENIMLSDSVFHTLVLEETDLSTGVRTKLWINKDDGYNVKSIVAGRQHVYFADKSVTSRITLANMDDVFFAKVGKAIPDIMNLSWMKIKAQINSYGENLTVTSLNFNGQKFQGKVTGSYIDGIFEIEPVRYDGKNAPPFPPDFRKSPELRKYLESEIAIESHDPLIKSEAARITAGSKDSWEAAIRLSKWVAENISGAVPGGITAVNTLKTGEAECGGHSRLLAAFCRAVGIPARLAVGCMYTPYRTGSFGQHAWTEVFMGDAGWIPVDATINEAGYVDAGHVRLGENATFRPVSMEILDFRSGSRKSDVVIPDNFIPLLGNYMNIEQYRMFKIIWKDNGLAIDIPGRKVLDLNPPDDHGRWYPELTREISLLPFDISEGKVGKIIMTQYFWLKKMSMPDSILNQIPEDLRKFAGNYQFAPAKLSLDVMFDNSALTTQDPRGVVKERIHYSKAGDKWIDKSFNYEIGFTTVNENQISGMTLTVKTEFQRGEPVTNAMEQLIRDSDIEAGLRKYDEIKNSPQGEFLFSEQMLHQVGHKLLIENRTDDAIKIFLKNVQEYPDSFLANDALAETYLKKGENKLALKYFKTALKLNPDYEYGRKMIEELENNK